MKLAALCVAAALIAAGCKQQPPAAGLRPIGKPVAIPTPLGLPPVPIPPDNPPTAETIDLGKRLYFDKRLSSDNSMSCATCHNPVTGFADPRRFSLGVGKKSGTRNSPTVLNAAYNAVQFWDGRAASLEHQAAGPIANPVEMAMPHDQLVAKLNGDPAYIDLFAKAFGPGRITMDHVQRAIASYERTTLSGNSPFDRYQYGADKTSLSESAIRGLAIFKDPARANCAACHTIGEKYALFTDGKFHNIGAGLNDEGELRDLGRYDQTKLDADRGAFRTPTLRNIARTAPYMHDGSLRTLREVVDFYVGGGSSNPYLDKEIRPIRLTRNERDDLIAFLQSLTGENPQ